MAQVYEHVLLLQMTEVWFCTSSPRISAGLLWHLWALYLNPHTHTHTILNNFTIELIFKMQCLTKNLKRDRIISGHIFTLAYLWLFFFLWVYDIEALKKCFMTTNL